jgi:hypothetical protein
MRTPFCISHVAQVCRRTCGLTSSPDTIKKIYADLAVSEGASAAAEMVSDNAEQHIRRSTCEELFWLGNRLHDCRGY